jgi:hypothetical protein
MVREPGAAKRRVIRHRQIRRFRRQIDTIVTSTWLDAFEGGRGAAAATSALNLCANSAAFADGDFTMDAPRTLIIDLADLPSLVALATQPAAEPFVAWHPHLRGSAADTRKRIVRAHSQVYSAARVVYGGLPIPDGADAHSPQWWIDSAILVDAMRVAQRLECCRIIWPVQAGGDFADLGPVIERSTLISSLARVGTEPIAIDLPLADLMDEQLVELADDCAAQMKQFWPCEKGDLSPCGGCDGCRRWMQAFETAGPAWPWAEVAEASQVAVLQ